MEVRLRCGIMLRLFLVDPRRYESRHKTRLCLSVSPRSLSANAFFGHGERGAGSPPLSSVLLSFPIFLSGLGFCFGFGGLGFLFFI